MNGRRGIFVRATTWVFAFSFAAATTFAGPPLICHSFDIGGAKSLPWISENWNLTGGENYNTKNLASDTIAILASSPVVLVHMETLRRATLYARKDPRAAKELLTRLVARAESAKSSSDPNALAIFDAGYLAEAYKQWLGEDGSNPANGFDGYALVKRALQLRGQDPQMEFAAALIALREPSAEQQAHAQKAIAGAKTDALLARNLFQRFLGAQSQTMAEMIRRASVAKVARQ